MSSYRPTADDDHGGEHDAPRLRSCGRRLGRTCPSTGPRRRPRGSRRTSPARRPPGSAGCARSGRWARTATGRHGASRRRVESLRTSPSRPPPRRSGSPQSSARALHYDASPSPVALSPRFVSPQSPHAARTVTQTRSGAVEGEACLLDDPVRLGRHMVVRELHRCEPVEDQGHPNGVARELILRAMPSIAEQLDDDAAYRETDNRLERSDPWFGSEPVASRARQPCLKSSRKRRSSQLWPPRLTSTPSITASSLGMPYRPLERKATMRGAGGLLT